MAERRQKHFLFPIGCLRLDKSLHEVEESDRSIILNRCLNLHLHFAMQDIDADDEQVIAAADNEAAKQGYTTQNDEWSDDEIALIYATRLSHFRHGEKDTSKILKQIRKSVSEVTIGRSRVSFPSELFWEAVQQWDFRDFAVLCSVWAAIGVCPYRRVTFDKIIRGAHGYSTEAEFKSLPKRVEPLSRRQARTTIEKLERRGFFVRCPMNRRHMAYSRQHGIGRLVEMVAKRIEEKHTPSMDERLAMVEALRRQNEK